MLRQMCKGKTFPHFRIDVNISSQTKERAQQAKEFLEAKYERIKLEQKERQQGFELLNRKMDQLKLTPHEKELIKQDVFHKEAELLRKSRKPISPYDFEPLHIIGRGAFGEV
jgi:serine/threonine kinase 38